MGFCFLVVILTLLLSRIDTQSSRCLLSTSPLTEYSETGDIMLGLIGPINTVTVQPQITFTAQPEPRHCDMFRRDQYKSILALLFATKEINENRLLPNTTLGFQMYDSCFKEAIAIKATVQVISGGQNPIPNYKCGPKPWVPAVIGDPLSSPVIDMARMLGVWRVPQISYAASLPTLSNKLEFPSFLRTVVSVDGQPQALIELCKVFGWTWVGILISSTEYGTQGGIALKKQASQSGVCIAFYETISLDSSVKRMPKIIENVQKSTASAVFLFLSPPEANAIFIEVIQQNVTGKTWVGIESWYTSPVFFQTDFWNLLNGSIGIAKSRKVLPNFSAFLQSFNPSTYPGMLSIRQYWERTFNCKWPPAMGNLSSSSGVDTVSQACTGSEKLVTNDIIEFNDPASQGVYMAHNALYAIVHALRNLLSCKPGEGPFTGKSCGDKYDIQPWQLLHYLKRVKFVNTAKEEVLFDARGDVYGYFDILNWSLEGKKSQYRKVGIFNDYNSDGQKLVLNVSAIQWAGGVGKVPPSVCSDNCPPGYRKAPQKGQPVCCFDCVPCPEGMISNQTRMCLSYYESRYTTNAMYDNGWSRDYGVFQINSYWWCNDGKTSGAVSACSISCNSLMNDDISDDITCAKRVVSDPNGMGAWVAWNNYCKNKDVSSFVSGCAL